MISVGLSAVTLAAVTATASGFVNLDCKEATRGCQATFPGSYCKYWQYPSVCWGSDLPCECAIAPTKAPIRPDCLEATRECQATFAGSYCKYWQNPPVCFGSDVPCACASSSTGAPKNPTTTTTKAPVTTTTTKAPVTTTTTKAPVTTTTTKAPVTTTTTKAPVTTTTTKAPVTTTTTKAPVTTEAAGPTLAWGEFCGQALGNDFNVKFTDTDVTLTALGDDYSGTWKLDVDGKRLLFKLPEELVKKMEGMGGRLDDITWDGADKIQANVHMFVKVTLTRCGKVTTLAPGQTTTTRSPMLPCTEQDYFKGRCLRKTDDKKCDSKDYGTKCGLDSQYTENLPAYKECTRKLYDDSKCFQKDGDGGCRWYNSYSDCYGQ